MSMTMKCHNHILQTTSRHLKEETQTTNIHMTSNDNEGGATSDFFTSEMTASLGAKLTTAQEKKQVNVVGLKITASLWRLFRKPINEKAIILYSLTF